MKFIISIIFLLTTIHKSYCQVEIADKKNSFVKYDGFVKLVDSAHVLFVTLSVNDSSKINVRKERQFSEDLQAVEYIHLYLKRKVRNGSVVIMTEALRGPVYTNDFDMIISVDKNSPVKDSLVLDAFYPLEIGEYSIRATLIYSFEGKQYIAVTDPIDFKVDFISPDSLY